MGLASRAAPGVEARAELVVESTCHLADAVTSTAWSEAAAEDALDAIDVLTAGLSQISPETAEALAAVTTATTATRRQLALPTDTDPASDAAGESAVPVPVPGTGPVSSSRPRSRRRGLGPGYRGISTGP